MVGLAEGAHLDEDGLLGGLREMRLITDPSRPPLLANPSPLLVYPDFFKKEELPLLDLEPPARASLFGRVTRYASSMREMTIPILSSPISLAHVPYRYPG